MKNQFLKTLCILSSFVLLLLGAQQAQATHLMGEDLTYRCIGPNQYEVAFTVYRDCNGINTPSSYTVNYGSASCNMSGTVTLQQNSVVDITPVCPGIVGTACNGGTGIYGIEKHTYTGVVTLPASCPDWEFTWTSCCRNNAITTLTNPGGNSMSVSTTLDNTIQTCNNSPYFLNDPTPFVCVGQNVNYNHGAFDSDGDSLHYSLTDCYDNSTTIVSYASGFSATNPLTTTNGFNLNPRTGAINFTAPITQVGVVCVLVEEFRNGVKIGEVVRDIQFTVVNCTNNAPTLSGIDNSNNFSTTVQAGNQICFDVHSNDVDANQTTSLQSNYGITGATFTSAGSPHAIGTFCWTPTATDAGIHTFTITVYDDYCPLVGSNTYTYTIEVTAPVTINCDSLLLALNSSNDLLCQTNDGSAVLVATGGLAPYDYQVINWTTGEFFTNQTGIFTNLTAGSYGTWVTDVNGCTPSCTGSTFTIAGNVNPLFATVNAQSPRCPSNAPYGGTGTSNNDGSIDVLATGGTAPYLYSIDGGITFQSTGTYANVAGGTYQVLVMDANGCSYIETVQIVEPTPIRIDVLSLTNATCGQANGSITLLASGGNGINFYYLNGQSQGTNPTFTGLAAGTYTFSVCDANYCIYDTTITIGGGPAFQVATATTNPSCNADCDGTAAVTVVGATNYTVQWSNGANGNTIDNLCAGTYIVDVTDLNGCVVSETVIITEPAPIDVVLASSSDETCRGNDGSANLSVTGGTAPYTIQLANFTTANSLNNSTGNFAALNAGLHIVHAVDANGCTQSCATQFTLEGCVRNVTGVKPAATPLAAFLQINPNPAATIAQARFDALSTTANITIVNAKGQRLYERTDLTGKGSLEMDISTWANATYFVILKNKKGEVVSTQRMIVRR